MNQLLNQTPNSEPPNSQPMGQLDQILQFLQTTKITPSQAQAQVERFIKDNSISKSQFEEIGNKATEIMRALGLH